MTRRTGCCDWSGLVGEDWGEEGGGVLREGSLRENSEGTVGEGGGEREEGERGGEEMRLNGDGEGGGEVSGAGRGEEME